jgi:beta-aspartyl-peptidase (threonine type)
VFEKEKDDKKKKASGRFTLIVRKFPDGWKVTHDHTSADEVK